MSAGHDFPSSWNFWITNLSESQSVAGAAGKNSRYKMIQILVIFYRICIAGEHLPRAQSLTIKMLYF